ncbi:MAG: endonuclease MutS2 [Lachnospiraceae bacterium]|nr:endonuclease MutS2 [Lachnospiraceae bacterium]
MNKKALATLEYDKIIQLLADKASSQPGRDMCLALTPGNSLSQIQLRQSQTGDALSRLFKKGSISFGSNHDVRHICKHLELGGACSSGELLRIASMLENVARVKNFGRTEKEHTDSLTGFFDELEPLTNASSEIRRCILAEDEFADDASSTLKHIRKALSHAGDKIHSQLLSMVNGSYRTYLQDAVITMRNNRYCIPVKAEHKNQVPGMVHERSQTGSTLFIEPAAIVELNNKIKELTEEEKEEIERILMQLSSMLAEHTEAITRNGELMTILDFIFAKAELAMEMNATEPLLNEDGIINIRQGRHPLLDKKKVVPIDVRLGDGFRQLIITGPNTGGKTVSLKTVGLFSLMAQAGLHIPALDRSRLTVFRNIYADIGDEQSIEQNLSTFSSHMTNIVRIMKEADNRSLVLFDELCAGTDPTEGAALAIAILSTLHERGCYTMATTHYSEIKIYALSAEGVENACCEFDVETLSPTYHLLIGVPGKSNAFAISGKLGLPEGIIDKAKEQMSSEQESFEDVLTSLETSRVRMEREKLEFDKQKEELEQKIKSFEKQQEKFEARKEKIIQEANEQARDILKEAKDVADETIRSFQKFDDNTSMKEMEKKRTKVRQHISDKDSKLTLKTPKHASSAPKVKASELHLGDRIKVLSMNLKGTVSSKPDAKGYLFVQCGIIRSKVHVSDLVLIPEDDITAPSMSKSSFGQIKMSKSANVKTEINLLGKTVDEAITALDKYLDDAYMAHIPSVRIVHGKGTGALRSAVQSHLKSLSYVSSYRLGEFGEGDSGVTIATFK